MFLVLIIAAALWFAGYFAGVSRRAMIAVQIVLFTAVLFFQLTLPPGNILKEATGESFQNWLIVAGIAAVVLGYRQVLTLLRRRHDAANTQTPAKTGSFKPEELTRYARHIVLREIGGPGQKKLKDARVLVIGAGGLGAPALQYLAAMGVGTIGVIDHDTVDSSNLQRQVIHTDARIGMPKVFSAVEAISAQNPFVSVVPFNRRFTSDIAGDLISDFDLILDGTDDPDTRYLVNEICVVNGVPLVSGAISQWEGQISLFHPASGGPCYQCVFPEKAAAGLAPSCAEAGVVGALPGVVGSMMALEAIKHLTGAGETLHGRMMIYDGLYAETRTIKVARISTCPICGGAS